LPKLVLKTVALTTVALIAFASNSVLGRAALADGGIDAASYTNIRLISGALMLYVIVRVHGTQRRSASRGSWYGALMLFLYAICFSYAYITLETGTGALILFGAVQITMILSALLAGDRLHLAEWLGVVIAFGGFVYLVLPGVSAPPLVGALLMALAGVAWGLYTLKGRGSAHPLLDTAYNFIRSVPFALGAALLAVGSAHYSSQGIALAAASGALSSGLGYTVWYAALGGLSATQAAVVQLLVPVIAALGGVIFVAEPITLRLGVAAMLILGGILLVVLGRQGLVRLRSHGEH
jgi:drug/metabolite transporter (DMT)-like permease